MSLIIQNPQQEIDKIISFLQKKYAQAGSSAVIAVSGGIDSALSLTLLTKALGKEKITPIFLPYGKQSIVDSRAIAKFNGFGGSDWLEINIEPVVQVSSQQLACLRLSAQVETHCDASVPVDRLRLGNIMARSRMLLLYDIAKQKNALVCGTENKSEKYLGYFTRFGDEASDIEPLVHLYKTQVRQLAKFLELPKEFLEKAPSAGLWPDQSDETELGFTYSQADKVLYQLVDEKKSPAKILQSDEIAEKVLARVEAVAFKQRVPYSL